MHVAISRLDIHIPDSHSLKEKRQVARSLTTRIRNRFNVAVAEEPNDASWQRLTLVLCSVSNNAPHSQQTLANVSDFVQRVRPDLELFDQSTEVLSGV